MASAYNTWRFWFDACLAGQAATTTIAIRSMRLQIAMMTGDCTGGPEGRRMIEEKFKATREGAFAASRRVVRASFKGPMALAAETPEILMAAARPAMKKSRANARRLTRLKKRR